MNEITAKYVNYMLAIIMLCIKMHRESKLLAKCTEKAKCTNVFKFFNQMSPQYTAEIFHPSSSVHNTRRATQKLDIPFRKSCIGQKTLSYIGPTIWNNLPAQIKLSKSVNTFKHDIKKSFFDDLQKQNDDIFFYY